METQTMDRKILFIGNRRDVMEGAGETVGRVLPQARLGLEPLDPFLMLDHFSGEPGGPGFPHHPHRGFEILTLVRDGWGSHKDTLGNEAKVGAGSMMRLTAGKGLWHDEAMGAEPGHRAEGLQFWINLRRADKGVAPSFQQVPDADFPRRTQDGGRTTVKVLVGPGSPARLLTPVTYLDVHVEPGGRFEWDFPAEQEQGFAYVLSGTAAFPQDSGVQEAQAGQVAVFGAGTRLGVEQRGTQPLDFVVAAGRPHREPVLWNGPFVD